MTDAWKQGSKIVERTSGGPFLHLKNDEELFIGVCGGKPIPREREWKPIEPPPARARESGTRSPTGGAR